MTNLYENVILYIATEALFRKENKTSVFVSINDSLDWKDLSAGEITKRVTERLAPGSIVLFHNAAKNTPEALPQILTKVREEGYTLVPISQLIYTENYKIDNSGRQINCEEN